MPATAICDAMNHAQRDRVVRAADDDVEHYARDREHRQARQVPDHGLLQLAGEELSKTSHAGRCSRKRLQGAAADHKWPCARGTNP